jgi:hypothetical protein
MKNIKTFEEYKIGDKVEFDGYDGMTSLDTVYDVWDSKEGQYVELDQNEISLSPKEQERVNLKPRGEYEEYKKENNTMKNLKNFADFVNEEFGEIDREHENHDSKDHGRYLDLEKVSNGLWIHLNDDGKKENEEEDNLSQERFWDYFEDIEVNSDWNYVDDLGEAGFGLTNAPGFTYGYHPDEESGKLTDDGDESSEVYYYDNYMITDFTDKLKEDGKVFFHKA